MVADRNHSNTSFITSFISYNTCYFHYRQIFFLPPLKSPTWLPTKSPTFIVGNQLPIKTITYWFSIIFLSDMLPTCLRHFSPTFTSALPPLLPPHYRQNNICTDILHRHLHRQNSSNLQRSQTNCKLITFPKLSQKKEEEGDHRKKQVYTLLYKDNTSTVLNIQAKC